MEVSLQKLIKTEHGFRPFEEEAIRVVQANTVMKSKKIALDLLKNEFYQVRSCGIFILGLIASTDKTVLPVLKDRACTDESWQVQEIIAKAFDHFCADNGYENSIPIIEEWLKNKNPNVCRAVTEGLRIWTGRTYFNKHPQKAIGLISIHKASKSEYLRKSVGNALRDIGKKHPELIDKEISQWDLQDSKVAFTYEYVKRRH